MHHKNDRGVILIIVMLIVALATILMTHLATSTAFSARVHNATVRVVQAEYLLKSAITLARMLIRLDESSLDSTDDPWRAFSRGVAIPPDLIQLSDPNVVIEIEIRPEESKLALQSLPPLGSTNHDRWRSVLVRLFQALGFDEDDEVDQTGFFPGRHFTSEELFANLMDYMDEDSDSYEDRNAAFVAGIESGLPPDTFPNRRISRLSELSGVPGFTATRLRKLTPYVTVYGGTQRVNLNYAPRLLLQVLSTEVSSQEVDALIEFRESEAGPITSSNKSEELRKVISSSTALQEFTEMGDVDSKFFQIIAKVVSGPTTTFARAYVQYERSSLPRIRSMEFL